MDDEKKQKIEYLKHLSTLSTGSIVVIATFLKDIFHSPKFQTLVVIAIGGFILSVISSVISYTFEVLNPKDKAINKFFDVTDYFFTVAMWLGLLLGLIFLAIFSIFNIMC